MVIDAASSATIVQRCVSVKAWAPGIGRWELTWTIDSPSVLDGGPLPRVARFLQCRQEPQNGQPVFAVRMELAVPVERLEKFAECGDERVLVADDVRRTPE